MASADRKVVAITGATKGLGRAMVLGCGRSTDAIDELRREPGPPHEFEAVDVAIEGQVRSWAAGLLDRHGPPDLLLNNAATINANAALWEVPGDDFGRVVDVNIKGTAHAIRHLVPAMIARGSGVIVNFSSGWGRSTSPRVAPYCASKWAIEGLTRALAQELPKGLAAVPLNPGIIDTEMLRSTFGDRAGDFPDPGEWAKSAVPFLLGLGPKDNGRPLTVPGH